MRWLLSLIVIAPLALFLLLRDHEVASRREQLELVLNPPGLLQHS